ncbi:hypothetical protein HYPSUDRAFT_217882 [Hypholoma sublateritium FD-334 SS-4]|uniref:Uncharacterized protein n=1 Tax=Hypholoma sublateritium (strain FD-334 SS-4) TaxID=945553 RepID=A0A0D2NJH3_HYPSF|nr:hypothetical protein HYPSUDRAFT_217882 [Hypholoma sublateritium FD-334 SS-4]
MNGAHAARCSPLPPCCHRRKRSNSKGARRAQDARRSVTHAACMRAVLRLHRARIAAPLSRAKRRRMSTGELYPRARTSAPRAPPSRPPAPKTSPASPTSPAGRLPPAQPHPPCARPADGGQESDVRASSPCSNTTRHSTPRCAHHTSHAAARPAFSPARITPTTTQAPGLAPSLNLNHYVHTPDSSETRRRGRVCARSSLRCLRSDSRSGPVERSPVSSALFTRVLCHILYFQISDYIDISGTRPRPASSAYYATPRPNFLLCISLLPLRTLALAPFNAILQDDFVSPILDEAVCLPPLAIGKDAAPRHDYAGPAQAGLPRSPRPAIMMSRHALHIRSVLHPFVVVI